MQPQNQKEVSAPYATTESKGVPAPYAITESKGSQPPYATTESKGVPSPYGTTESKGVSAPYPMRPQYHIKEFTYLDQCDPTCNMLHVLPAPSLDSHHSSLHQPPFGLCTVGPSSTAPPLPSLFSTSSATAGLCTIPSQILKPHLTHWSTISFSLCTRLHISFSPEHKNSQSTSPFVQDPPLPSFSLFDSGCGHGSSQFNVVGSLFTLWAA
ncbi:hypothetical protein Droror1_Dr00005800 [Drosera rotundifolia]